jgi:hypothetical protein
MKLVLHQPPNFYRDICCFYNDKYAVQILSKIDTPFKQPIVELLKEIELSHIPFGTPFDNVKIQERTANLVRINAELNQIVGLARQDDSIEEMILKELDKKIQKFLKEIEPFGIVLAHKAMHVWVKLFENVKNDEEKLLQICKIAKKNEFGYPVKVKGLLLYPNNIGVVLDGFIRFTNLIYINTTPTKRIKKDIKLFKKGQFEELEDRFRVLNNM